jgi:transposase
MNPSDALFHVALGLNSLWIVRSSELSSVPVFGEAPSPGALVLELDIDFTKGALFACPTCGNSCPVHDTDTRVWRHLNFWQHSTYLRARVPRVRCAEHGVHTASIPWARAGSGFTLMFEAMVMALSSHMPMTAVAEQMGECDTALWRVLHHYVDRAHGATSWTEMKTIAVDETSAKKGHRYVTAVVDVDSPEVKEAGHARLIFLTPGRKAESLAEFAAQMPAHGAEPGQIELAALDMGKAFIKGVTEHLPNAKICLDRFHVMQLTGKAIDELRRWLQSIDPSIKGSMWALRGNEKRLSDKQRATRARLCKEHQELARAFALRDELQNLWSYTDELSPDGKVIKAARELAKEHLAKWCAWAQRSRLEGFVKIARTLREHAASILNYYPSHLTSAAIESINSQLQNARRRARGFRSFKNFRAIAYWIAGQLKIKVPTAV